MILSKSYRNAFAGAIALHLSIVIVLFLDPTSQHPVLVNQAKNEASAAPMELEAKQAQAIKAVSVDSQEVLKTMNKLKDERARQQRAEQERQRTLNQQAELARKQRIEEQKRIETLKNEANQLAIARQKQIAEEQKHLKELAEQKVEQEKHLAEMKKQQVLEAQKLVEIQKKKIEAEQLKKAELAKAELARAAEAKAELAKKEQAAAQQAAQAAAKRAQVAGEVDKYKALIINAISRQWILPENANSSLSSQFRIRLAPNGAVLEVSLTRSSGDLILDRSAQAAIYKASPLPVPTDPTTFDLFRDISLTVRPVNARG